MSFHASKGARPWDHGSEAKSAHRKETTSSKSKLDQDDTAAMRRATKEVASGILAYCAHSAKGARADTTPVFCVQARKARELEKEVHRTNRYAIES